MNLDRRDAAVLRLLQADSNRSIAGIAQEAGLSVSACQRRIKALEAAGVIAGYSARLDPEALGLEMHAIVEITLAASRGRYWRRSRRRCCASTRSWNAT